MTEVEKSHREIHMESPLRGGGWGFMCATSRSPKPALNRTVASPQSAQSIFSWCPKILQRRLAARERYGGQKQRQKWTMVAHLLMSARKVL